MRKTDEGSIDNSTGKNFRVAALLERKELLFSEINIIFVRIN